VYKRQVYLLQDPGLLWFSHFYQGGTPAGVVKVVFTPHEFRHISPFPEKSSQLNVFGIIRDDSDALWIAARDRNYLIRTGTDGVAERKLTLNDRDLVELWHPRAFLSDTGGLWIGYYYRKLLHYDLQTGKVEEHYPGKWAHTLCYDGDGKILVAESGIRRYDPVSRTSEVLLMVGDTVNWFTMHRQGDILWAGGSYSYLMKLNLVTREHEFTKIASSMANIEDICEDDNGVLWLSTLGMGVCRFDAGTGEKTFYTTASGLSSNTTYSILRDGEGNIWVSTNNGISVINLSLIHI
jgi:ligand-binding sensor domain-containing protein